MFQHHFYMQRNTSKVSYKQEKGIENNTEMERPIALEIKAKSRD
jgi:hypothetical protein